MSPRHRVATNRGAQWDIKRGRHRGARKNGLVGFEFVLISHQFISLDLRRLVDYLLELHRGVYLREEGMHEGKYQSKDFFKDKINTQRSVSNEYLYLFLIFIGRALLRCGIIVFINCGHYGWRKKPEWIIELWDENTKHCNHYTQQNTNSPFLLDCGSVGKMTRDVLLVTTACEIWFSRQVNMNDVAEKSSI